MNTEDKLKEAQEEYGQIESFIERLRELNRLNDLRDTDIKETLRDINFIRSQADLDPITELELLEKI